MPVAKSTCSHCILDGTPLTFDRAAKLEHHRQQKHHKIAQEAYERGLQEGCNSTLVEGMTATHLQPVSVEMPPHNAVETETAYAHGFQDGKAAEKAMHDTVIKAMLDSHTRDIEAAFKRGKEHSIVTAASQTLPLLPTQVGRLQSDLQQEPYAQGVAAPQLQPALENTTKDFQPPAKQSPSDTSICSGSDSFDKPGDTNAYSVETDTQNTCNLAAAAQPPPLTRQLSVQHQKEAQILEQQPAPGLTLPQASSEATPADLEHHMCQPMLSTELGPAVNPTTSSCTECTSTATPISEAEDDVAVLSKVIRDVWVYNKGNVDTERICRCPSTGRLQVLNRLGEEWAPLTDSDRLVADVSKLLDILQHLTHLDKCAGEPAPFCSLEQMRSLKKCSRAVDIHDGNFDPCKAKALTMQLAKCLPNLPSGQKNSVLGSQKSTSTAKTLSNTSTSCRAKTRKNAAR